jgi:methionyl-tRNA formyltransferase
MVSQPQYLVAGCKPWNRRVFNETLRRLPGMWHYVETKDQLDPGLIGQIGPRYIFFLHWSWIVPEELVDAHECVCFHMADVPYGRGGSPLQNLIARGHRDTMLTALRMVKELDAGPVYGKEPLSLEGSAEEILIRATELSARMIERIVREEPEPIPQHGEAVVFRRRKPHESRIPQRDSLAGVYDFIRMLDAEGYPHAFLTWNGFKYEFRRAALHDGRIEADVTITPCKDTE